LGNQGPLAGAGRGMNVVMVLLESVGTRHLSVYGAPYDTTPNLQRLASHALTFDRIYAPQSFTSSALGAVFCSIFPRHQSTSLGKYAAGLNIPGMGDVLRKAGYRSGFLYDGRISYDREDVFLRKHGFGLESLDIDPKPDDSKLVRQATAWIQRDTRNPFFLAMLTRETHSPYLARSTRDFKVTDSSENRYLNGIVDADAMIGDLAKELDRMGLSEQTLLVVLGDHGEAFGEHGQLIHNFSIFEEETHIPLLIVNPRLFRQGKHQTGVGQQLDIAPTVLSMLGIAAPGSWQGRTLLSNPRFGRAYLFANSGVYSWGLVDGDLVFMFDETADRLHIYNLSEDPGESHDLAGHSELSAKAAEARQRLAAWSHFQNRYLDSYHPR
jgi:lipoteichoic acid synthase